MHIPCVKLPLMKTWFIFIISILFLTACAPQNAEVALTPESPPVLPANTKIATPTLIALPTDTPPPTAEASPTPSPTPSPVKLVLWENLPSAQHTQLLADVANFEQDNLGFSVDIQHYDDTAPLADAIIGGRVDFDLILGAAPILSSLQQADKLQPMSAFFPPSFLDAFAGVTLSGVSRDGEKWGLPDTAGFHLLLFFNRDLIETPPATFDELLSVAQNSFGVGKRGVALNSFDPLWVLPWVSGEYWIVDEKNALTLDTPAMISALKKHAQLSLVSENATPKLLDYVTARQLFKQGDAAILMDGEWMLESLQRNSDINWAVAPLPSGASPLVLGRYWAVGADTGGRQTEGAIRFLEYITGADRQLAWTAKFGLLPTRRDALTAPQIRGDEKLRVSALQLQQGRGVPLGVNADALLQVMRLPLDQFLEGNISAETAAEMMQSAVDEGH